MLSNLDRQIALRRILEAIRDYAARHDGQMPASLNQIMDLPLPLDPITGNSFEYHADQTIAVIEAPAPEGISAALGRRFELKIAK